MAKVPEYYEVGDRNNLTVERLLQIIEDMYKDLAVALNKKIEVYERPNDGLTTDTVLSNGDVNINTSTLKVEMLVSHNSPTSVTWSQLN